MQQFKVTIKSDKGDEIVLGNLGEESKDRAANAIAGTVTGVDVRFDTIDENATQKSHGMIARVTVYGRILKENHKTLKEVMQWAIDNKGDTEYRNVLVEMIVSAGEEAYGYEIPDMFVVDYAESYHGEGSGDGSVQKLPDTFELKLSQRANYLSEINPF